jgi:hypothetical protein
VVKIRHTKQKKKKKSVPVDSLRVDTPAMRAADYKLYRPKSTVKNIGVKAM